MPEQEKIWFTFWFTSFYWDRPPHIKILIDDVLLHESDVVESSCKIELQTTLTFSPHRLTVIRGGKTPDQTRMLPDGSYETQYLTLDKLEIDRINVRNLIWHDSKYFPIYPEPWATEQRNAGHEVASEITGELFFGHNGTWQFDFASPFYQYLVDRITK